MNFSMVRNARDVQITVETDVMEKAVYVQIIVKFLDKFKMSY